MSGCIAGPPALPSGVDRRWETNVGPVAGPAIGRLTHSNGLRTSKSNGALWTVLYWTHRERRHRNGSAARSPVDELEGGPNGRRSRSHRGVGRRPPDRYRNGRAT